MDIDIQTCTWIWIRYLDLIGYLDIRVCGWSAPYTRSTWPKVLMQRNSETGCDKKFIPTTARLVIFTAWSGLSRFDQKSKSCIFSRYLSANIYLVCILIVSLVSYHMTHMNCVSNVTFDQNVCARRGLFRKTFKEILINSTSLRYCLLWWFSRHAVYICRMPIMRICCR